jgi:hypothetical protein
MIVHSTLQNVVFGAKAEVAAAAGFDSSIPDAFVDYYKQEYGVKVRQAEGDAARISQQVFENYKGKLWMK